MKNRDKLTVLSIGIIETSFDSLYIFINTKTNSIFGDYFYSNKTKGKYQIISLIMLNNFL